MYVPSLPNDVSGFWIWLPDGLHIDNRQVFARKKIIIDKEISSSELRICVIPFYHLFINGKHIGQGSAFPTNTHCYVDIYDVTKYLKPGENAIAISTLDLLAPTWNMHSYPAKFWCQLFVNGKQLTVTDESWRIVLNDRFSGSQPRCHFGLARTEQKKVNHSKNGWVLSSYDDSSWDVAKCIQPFPEGKPQPVLSGLKPRFWNHSEAFPVTASGTFEDPYSVTYYNYHGFRNHEPGNYAAQAFAFSTEERDVEMRVSSDDPYMVFCNQDLIAVNQKTFVLGRYETWDSLQPGIDILEAFSVHLKKGWNRFLCFQNLSRDSSMGLMLLFPQLKKGLLHFQREPDNDVSKIGWQICGPLQTPFNYSSPSLLPDELPEKSRFVFVPSDENVNDTSAYLSICNFALDNSRNPQELHQGEFLIYDLGHFHYGFPCLEITGSPGDIVDFTCGLRLGENHIPMTIGPLGRMTDTLILGTENQYQWIRMLPRGSRYVMISVRKAESSVNPVFHFISAASQLGSDSYFHCSDDLLNDGWKRAMDSLGPCVSQNIIDDPCAKRCQTLPESFIYSRALYNLTGGCDIPEKALREFAETQLETGMIMKTAPSGFYAYSPDAALLWIIWLEDHLMYTGDLDFIRSMIPCLSRLLRFFRMLAPEDHAILQSERAGHCAFLNKNRDMEETNIFTMLNALYYRALVASFKLYAALGMKENAMECEQLAAVLAEELIFYTKSPRTGIFADCYANNQRSDTCSIYTNLMVLNSGIIKTPNDINNLLKFCFRSEEALLSDCDSPFLFFILETLFDYNRNDFAFKLLRMAIDRSLDKPCIYALGGNPHITCITAVGFLIRQLLGVRPHVPGGTQISFAPACSLLSNVQCRLPMGNGLISVDWSVERNNLIVDMASNSPIGILPKIPDGYEAAVDINKFITLINPGETQE